VTIVADENVDRQIVDHLRVKGHDVLYVAELDPGIDDETVLQRSRSAGTLLVTGDKDFGDLVFRERLDHAGVLLFRLGGLSPTRKAALVADAIELYGEEMGNGFAVLSERSLRLRPKRT
jgi:predicted nuclease of predicted toxin-antitoxin system